MTIAVARTPYDRLPSALLEEIAAVGLDPAAIYDHVVAGFNEDLPGDDVTSWSTIPPEQVETADLVARADGTVAGGFLAELVFRYVVGDAQITRTAAEGAGVRIGDVILTVTGPTALLLTAERTALNYLCHLSGVATATARWVSALSGTGAQVRDTRKTLPHYRALEKYAVRAGGGLNHRFTLSDQGLVKDNHVLAAGGVVHAYQRVAEAYPGIPIQVEVTTVAQVEELLAVGATDIMLDNMPLDEMRRAVRVTGGRARLEASGGLTLESAAAVAGTGVDLIAVGELTHSAPVLDVAMDLRPR